MSTLKPIRRQFTAHEAVERLGVTTHAVQRLMAESRDQYLTRANAKREGSKIARARTSNPTGSRSIYNESLELFHFTLTIKRFS